MTIIADIKETIKPINIIITELRFNASELLYKSQNEAANIMGIARKKENSADAFLESPAQIPPIIVEPALDTPGIKANI